MQKEDTVANSFLKLFEEENKYHVLRKFIKLGIKKFDPKLDSKLDSKFLKDVNEKYLKSKHTLNIEGNVLPNTVLERNVLEFWIDCGKFDKKKLEQHLHLENKKLFVEKFINRCMDWTHEDFLIKNQENLFFLLSVSSSLNLISNTFFKVLQLIILD